MVEQRKQPHLRGQPTAVVQYNNWKGGGLIAVSYEARSYGVNRSMRGDEAKQVCPHIQLVQVPVARGKADLGIYRNAGSEVVSILSRKGRCERASIDEVYLDLTDAVEAVLAESTPNSWENFHEEALKSHILGLNEDGTNKDVREWFQSSYTDHHDKLLACGAHIVAELRMQVLKETEFTCSAGIAHNKMLAKLASGMNKPAQQTVVPLTSVKGLLETLPIKKMKQLGGKLGSSLQIDLGVNTVGDLLQFSVEKLQERYGINTGTWLWNIARGISGEEVEGRLLPKSHGSGKNFPGRQALKSITSVEHWIGELCEELSERLQSDLDQNKRIARTLTLHASAFKSSDSESQKKFPSKSCPLRYGSEKIKEDALSLFQGALREFLGSHGTKAQASQCSGWGITNLSVSASKIVAVPTGTQSIMKYFGGQDQHSCPSKKHNDETLPEDAPSSPSGSERNIGLHPVEPSTFFHEEETEAGYSIPTLNQQDMSELIKREGTTSFQDPSCGLVMQSQDVSIQDTSALSSSGKESCLEINKGDPSISQCHKEESGNKCVAVHVKRPQELKKKTVNDKGTQSIMKYFGGQDKHSCPSKKHNDETLPEDAPSSPSESESNAGLHPVEPSTLFHETEAGYSIPSQNLQDMSELVKIEGTTKDPSCGLIIHSQDVIIQETSALSSSGKESCLEINKSEPSISQSHTEESGNKCAVVLVKRPQETKKRMVTDKGATSILRFFKSCSNLSSSPHVGTMFEAEAATSSPSERLEQTGSDSGVPDEENREGWRYKFDEIDPNVVNELPPEIQQELRAWLRPQKRANITKQPHTIARYFKPANHS